MFRRKKGYKLQFKMKLTVLNSYFRNNLTNSCHISRRIDFTIVYLLANSGVFFRIFRLLNLQETPKLYFLKDCFYYTFQNFNSDRRYKPERLILLLSDHLNFATFHKIKSGHYPRM